MDKSKIYECIDKFGDAFYLLDSKQFENNFIELKNSFSKIYNKFNIAYSYKTNYAPRFCKIVNNLGGYAETVSEMEVDLALRIGVEYNKIIWNGPIKDNKKMEEFLLLGGNVNIDSIDEIRYIKKMADKNINNIFNVGIRCNYDVLDGVVSRFGFDIDSSDFNEALNIIKVTPNIKFICLHCHFAKRQIEYWKNRVDGMLSLIDKIGIIPERIDLGGGLFGKMPESLKNQFSTEIPNYDEYANVIANKFEKHFSKLEKKPELIIEPGSALVGDCMKFVSTIKTIKNIRGKYFATLLASQKNISMTSVNPPIEILSKSKETKNYKNIDFVGYTCIESDVLYKNYSGNIGVGDIVIFSNCGSYSIVMKPPFILPNFPIIDISHNKIELIKRKENFEDVFRTFEF